MFSTLQSDLDRRILTIQTFFKESCSIAHPAASPTTLTAVAVVKGLTFVELYGIYEQTLVRSVQAALVEMNNSGMTVRSIRLELVGLALDPEIRAVTNCGRERIWDTRMQLFRRVDASDANAFAAMSFPDDGSHFRERQLRTIWEMFGITAEIVPAPRFLGRIKELVENRNAIAHGRLTAHDVGRDYSVADVEKRIVDTRDLCNYIAATVQSHCSNMANLQR